MHNDRLNKIEHRLKLIENKIDRILLLLEEQCQDDELNIPAKGEDDLYSEALNLVRKAGLASPALIQSKLKIGYARAARLVDILEENGIVGPPDGAKPRDVLIKL